MVRDTIARKEIKKFYGDKVLKSKEVQQALQYANEAVSPAQRISIAISKKEKEKPLDESDMQNVDDAPKNKWKT